MSPGSERSIPPSPTRFRALLAAAALVLGVVAARASARWLEAAPPGAEQAAPPPAPAALAEAPAELEALVLAIARDADAVWAADFKRRGKPYAPAEPVLLDASSEGDCGPGIALGLEACHGTARAHIDLSFQRALGARLGEAAAGARAYVIAHELGHHVQRVLGLDRKLAELLAERQVAAHWVEVQLELQADCLAGIYSRRTRHSPWSEPSQIEASLRHASELGTERRLARPQDDAGETFTYAIPRRRIYWFAQGYTKGELDACDTFAP